MATRPPRSCLKCGAAHTNRGWYCESCGPPPRERPASSDPRIHETAAWHRLRENLRAQGNVFCQHVDGDGRRCTEPVWGFHHIIEGGSRPDLILNQRNIVGLCRGHHPKPADRDQLKGGVGYVPTLWRTPMSGEPLPETICQPGAVLGMSRWHELWTAENREEELRRR